MVSTFTPASAASLAIVRPFIPSLSVIAAACRYSTVRTLVRSQEVFCSELNTALCLLAGIVINRWQSVPIAENRLHVQTSLDVLWCNILLPRQGRSCGGRYASLCRVPSRNCRLFCHCRC